jgi:drug/metabolite transporter (DMT)-like permease
MAHFKFNAGDLWMLAAIVTWGLFAVAGRKSMETVSPYMSTLWGAVFGVLIMLPFDLPTFYLDRTDFTFWTLLLLFRARGYDNCYHPLEHRNQTGRADKSRYFFEL